MLAQQGPLANESLTWKRMPCTVLTNSSQNFPMPSRPRWPAPSGSSMEGPTGSSTSASAEKAASQLVTLSGGGRGHGPPRREAGGMVAVRRFPDDSGGRGHPQNCNVFSFRVKG